MCLQLVYHGYGTQVSHIRKGSVLHLEPGRELIGTPLRKKARFPEEKSERMEFNVFC